MSTELICECDCGFRAPSTEWNEKYKDKYNCWQCPRCGAKYLAKYLPVTRAAQPAGDKLKHELTRYFDDHRCNEWLGPFRCWKLQGHEGRCTTAPSVTNSVAQPATGSTKDTGTVNADTWRTIIVGLPIIRKLLNGEDVSLETFKVNLIPDDVLWNARAALGRKEG